MSKLKLWTEEDSIETRLASNDHRVLFPFASVTHWGGGVAMGSCGFWDRAVIAGRGEQFPQFEVKVADPGSPVSLSDASRQVVTILRLLATAYNRGGDDRSEQFRILIGAAVQER